MVINVRDRSAQVSTDQPEALRLRLEPGTKVDASLAAVLPVLAVRPVAFEIASQDGEAGLYLCGDGRGSLGQLISSSMPGLSAERTAALTFAPPVVGWNLQTTHVDAWPLLPSGDAAQGLTTSLVGLLASADAGSAAFQVVVAPLRSERWRVAAKRELSDLTKDHPGFLGTVVGLMAGPSHPKRIALPRWLATYQQRAFEKADAAALFAVSVRFIAADAPGQVLRALAMGALRLVTGAFAGTGNGLQVAPLEGAEQLCGEFNARAAASGFVASPAELAPLLALPRNSLPSLEARARSVDAPREATVGEARIGRDTRDRPIFLRADARGSGLLVLGKTGAGKTTLILNLALADIAGGDGLLFIDPKGDAVQDLLERLTTAARDRLRLLSPAEGGCGFNPLAVRPGSSAAQVAGDVCAALSRLYDTWGHRLERVLWQALVAVQAKPGATLMDVHRFLSEPRFRQELVPAIEDDFVRRFWAEEFAAFSAGVKAQWVEPVLTRLDRFLHDGRVQRFLAPAAAIDPRTAMDEGLIVLADLAAGKIGEDNSFVLANLLTAGFHQAALSRADVAPAERRPFSLIVDEAFATAPATFVKLLPQIRAFRVNVTLASQYLEQFPRDLVQALLANVGSVVAFRLGEPDAALLEGRFRPGFRAGDLTGLANYHAAARLLADGALLPPFTLFGDPLPPSHGAAWAMALRAAAAPPSRPDPERRQPAPRQLDRQQPDRLEAEEWDET